MSRYFAEPNPVLIVDDTTGEFVMTHNITRVIRTGRGSRVYVKNDMQGRSGIGEHCYIESDHSPKQLHKRLFDLGDN